MKTRRIFRKLNRVMDSEKLARLIARDIREAVLEAGCSEHVARKVAIKIYNEYTQGEK